MKLDPTGWLEPGSSISLRPSPNFNARPAGVEIDLLVIHNISLPPGRFGTPYVADLFLNQLDLSADPWFEENLKGLTVSAHFLIDRLGHITQFVSCDARSWHAGRSSWRGRDNCNDWSVGIELEGLEGQRFETAQYRALARLLRALARRYPVVDVVGHEHVAPGRKADPGAGFDWFRLARSLARTSLRVPFANEWPRNARQR